MINDDDKNMTRMMIGGALLINALAFAVGYDAGYQSASKQNKGPTIVYGNQVINNSNNFNSSQPTALDK